MLILGLNAYHGDASACLVEDGEVLVAIEEERLLRVKHASGFPSHAIRACLIQTGKRAYDIDYISIAKNPRVNLRGRYAKAIKSLVRPRQLLAQVPRLIQSSHNLSAQVAAAVEIETTEMRARHMPVEHHIAHIASAFYCSGLQHAAGVSVDGLGDNLSTLITQCEGDQIYKLAEVAFPHSLGFYYTAITQFLGFPHYGDEYKVMGLAASGRPNLVNTLRQMVTLSDNDFFKLDLSYFVHHKSGVTMNWDGGTPTISTLYGSDLSSLLGPPRSPEDKITQHHRDIACSAQQVYEEVLAHILCRAKILTGQNQLVFAGGCSQNSLANGRVPQRGGFKQVYIPPSGHDGGTAVGAALVTATQKGIECKSTPSPYLGSTIDTRRAIKNLERRGVRWRRLDDEDLYRTVIQCVETGGVVGWVQGRAEWGPRALGNRSILADPRREDMQEILNIKIKRRESFRPFAPSVIHEHAHDWFVLDSVTANIPYMEKVVAVQPDKITLIPAVVHLDGTARAQLVTPRLNQRFWELLKVMHLRTGCPMLLNTSFNENEPIVETAEDAIDCFHRTTMDMLVLENIIVQR